MINSIVIDAGHGMCTSGKQTLDGQKEWELNSRIATLLCAMLTASGIRVYRADDISGATDIKLDKRVKLANDNNVDMYLSIHHNAGIKGGKGGGTTVYYYSTNPVRKTQAERLYKCVVNETNLIGNRAQKVIKNNFYVLRKTKMPAFLIENGFMDSVTDLPIIKSEYHAEATAIGLYNFIMGF